jgi:regulator of cell morphogenesis and NO signaling
MNTSTPEKTVGQLVAERPSRSRVFETFGIDYCCGGKKRLTEACETAGAVLDEVIGALKAFEVDSKAEDETDWSKVPMSHLIDHIVSTHHAYLGSELPRLSAMTEKVAMVHGRNHPELLACRDVFAGFRAELESHMGKEENVLFPMIKVLESASSLPESHCGTVQNPIRMMEHEHDDAGRALAKLRELTDGFAPPEDACNTYRACFDGLAELEADLHQHIHKENNILFPRAAQAEERPT